MGLLSFAKSVGRKLGVFGDTKDEAATAKAKASAAELAAASRELDQQHLRDKAMEADILAAIASHGLRIEGLAASVSGSLVKLTGKSPVRADAEKAALVAGNTEGIETVDDQIEVPPTPPAVYHTVVSGDTLSKIAAAQYGVMRLYDAVFEANQPMLTHPDKIYPGQVLRIPPVAPPKHTVASGETLGSIAKHWYGDAKKYVAIFDANRGVLSDPNVVNVGQVLTIPLIDPKVAPLA